MLSGIPVKYNVMLSSEHEDTGENKRAPKRDRESLKWALKPWDGVSLGESQAVEPWQSAKLYCGLPGLN